MKKTDLLIYCLFLMAQQVLAQSNTIKGVVKNGDEILDFANVALLNTEFGTFTDEQGIFELSEIPNGSYDLVISVIGYKRLLKKIPLTENQPLDLGVLELQEDILGLEEVVVTGTMRETFVTASPIKVDVITSRYLEKNIAPTNLMEGVSLINGVEEVVACGVCFTNSISINGLPGPYTAVLMDGTPIYGNLAAVYGLNGIPTTIIDRIEVIKGPSSTLYGSEAVAGVINIITKDPSEQPFVSLDIMGTNHLESFGNIAFAPKVGKFDTYVGLNYAYINGFDDENGDGFGDRVNLDRFSGFTKWEMRRKDDRKFSLSAKYYYEDRRNGVEEFLTDRAYKNLRGSDEVYGESIYTNRIELFGTYELPTVENLKLDFSFSNHLQDSYYGGDAYEATQRIGFTNFTWNKAKGKHLLLSGLTMRYQFYDDNSVATVNRADEQFIPGIFIQDEWKLSKRLTLLAGTRLDHYKAHGLITSPRLNLKYNPSTWTTLRANFGTGFRIVNLFTEDHAFVTGQRTVEILESLEPERSYNASLNINHLFLVGKGQGMIDIDLFYTYFTNKIIPDYNTPGKIIYANTDGFAVSKGIGLNLNHQFGFPLAFNLGLNIQNVTQTEADDLGEDRKSDVEFAPTWSGIATLNYKLKKQKLTLAYTFKITGPMMLPEVFDLDENGSPLTTSRPTQSEAFTFHNIQVSKSLPKQNMEVYLGIQNLFNYTQDYSPLIGFNDPNAAPGFSDFFDTSYAFSPLEGREVYFGLKWNFE